MSELPPGFDEWSTDEQAMFLRGSTVEALQVAAESQPKRPAPAMQAMSLEVERGFCAKLKQLREQRGWSQNEMAVKLSEYGFDLHQTTIAKLEAGKRPLRVAELFAFGLIFGLPPGAIFFMPVLAGDFPAMDELDRRLNELETYRDEARQRSMRVLDTLVATEADFEYKRLQLVRDMAGMNRSGGNDGEHPEAP
ncbi:hypothetical protein B7495_04715 [Cryobacterium sp. LW097]|uniref:helix-turn-helix transcriptional regulator n=1 Tax=Cryobacterium sp. LW097 TaxID=1978566 RepID=UPI000B4D4F8F|nr:helix-turn-helix transcriptional regulator [Cryobacterium sp. LW097]ASD21476.1 hypothetical protein B7495_04715 [Cryobacterium sp. LW097]